MTRGIPIHNLPSAETPSRIRPLCPHPKTGTSYLSQCWSPSCNNTWGEKSRSWASHCRASKAARQSHRSLTLPLPASQSIKTRAIGNSHIPNPDRKPPSVLQPGAGPIPSPITPRRRYIPFLTNPQPPSHHVCKPASRKPILPSRVAVLNTLTPTPGPTAETLTSTSRSRSRRKKCRTGRCLRTPRNRDCAASVRRRMSRAFSPIPSTPSWPASVPFLPAATCFATTAKKRNDGRVSDKTCCRVQ
ncbi:hypothetical protein BT67DRAFT_50579 [Trichocladium antarcticum]|uniref:Uncharacterized protein n=1 Tax=Trichocladium antarcticum TaxID=1450529 RepID=A0AAN6ZDH0_9PEZI|nr:hypothetical protein BT67DRAFT_50579 [Trichocladium antarcticum]